MSATDVVAVGCGRLGPRGGDRRRSTGWLLRTAEMRLKSSGSAAGGSAAGGGGCCAGWGAGKGTESHGARKSLGGLAVGWALSRAGLVWSSVAVGGGGG